MSKFFVFGIPLRLFFGFVNAAVNMIGWRVNSIQFQFFVSGIYDIMFRAGRHYESKIVRKFHLFSVDYHFAFARFNPKKLVYVLEEIWRITKPQGKIIFKGPHFTGASAATNPTHLRQGFSSQLFCYFISENEYPNYGKISFKVNKIILRKGRTRNPLINLIWITIETLANLNPLVCEQTWGYLFGGFFEIEFQLQPKK